MKVLTEERSWFHDRKAGRFPPPLLPRVRSPPDLSWIFERGDGKRRI